MGKRFLLGALATATMMAVLPAGAAVAQAQPPGQSPAQGAAVDRPQVSLATVHLVTGTVRDQSGRALGGICVLVTGADSQVRMARTAGSGRYELSLARAGAYSVQYRGCQPGRASEAAVAPAAAHQIQVGAGPLTTLPAATVRLGSRTSDRAALEAAGVTAPPAGRIFRAGTGRALRVPGASGPPDAGGLTGRVTNPAGHPLAGICVFVVTTGGALGIATGKNGTYKFDANELFPGRYLVLFANCSDANPFVPIAPGPWAPQWYNGKFAQAKADKVHLRAHRVTRGINAVMQRAGEVSGTLTGSDHRRLKGVCAVLTDAAGNEFGQTTTNAKGHYVITGLDPGRYRLLANGTCAGDYGQVWYPHAASVSTARSITVRLGHRTGGIDVVLPKLGTITGFVRVGGPAGKPLGGICVSVFSPSNFEAGGFATSQKSGKYVVAGLPAGRYQVDANAEGCGNNGNYAPASSPHSVRVTNAKTTAGINLYMQPGGTLTGTVTDAATNKPLSGICVNDGNFNFGVTGTDGTYTIDQLPAEHTTVVFNGGCGNAGSFAPQYFNDQVTQEAAQSVTVTAGHITTGIGAHMLPGATIAGRVTNSAGRPVSGVCVGIVPPGQIPYADEILGGNAETNSAGDYTVANLPEGGYAAVFFGGCLGPSNAAALQWYKGQPAGATAGLINARAGVPVSGIDAVVGRGGGISGTVTGTNGQVVGFDCATAISRRTGQPSGFQSLTGSGTYTISSLAPGDYTVVASDCDGSNLAQSVYGRAVTVRRGSTTAKINFKLPAGGVITGRVTARSDGRPVSGACVEAFAASNAATLGIGSAAVTSGSGTYRIVGLRTGAYIVEVVPGCVGPDVNLQSAQLPRIVRVAQGKVKVGVNAALHAGGQITGQITGPGAVAVPGACAEAVQIPGGLAASGVADAHGTYIVTGLTPGQYKVEFGDASCSDAPAGLAIQWYQGVGWSGPATVITIKAGRTVSGIDGSLPADGTITGAVTGTGSAPLTGVCISAVPLAAAQRTVYTISSAGRYTVTDLLPGKYRVEFQAGCGKSGVKTQWWQGAGTSGGAKIINVAAGATVGDIDAAMTGG